jgi:hypothetical protein
MAENLMVGTHKYSTDKFRDKYSEIKWDSDKLAEKIVNDKEIIANLDEDGDNSLEKDNL